MNNETLTHTSDTFATIRPGAPNARRSKPRTARYERDDFLDVAEAVNTFRAQVLDQAKHLRRSDLAVALAVEHLVARWTRLGDYVSRGHLADVTGLHPSSVTRSLRNLSTVTSLIWEPGNPTRRGWVGFVPSREVIHNTAEGALNTPGGGAQLRTTNPGGGGAYGAPKGTSRGLSNRGGKTGVSPGAPAVTGQGFPPSNNEPEHNDGPPGPTGNPEPGNDATTDTDRPPPQPADESQRPATLTVVNMLLAMLHDNVPNVDRDAEVAQLVAELNGWDPGWEPHLEAMFEANLTFRYPSGLRKALKARTPQHNPNGQRERWEALERRRSCPECRGTGWGEPETHDGPLPRCQTCQTNN